VLTRRRLRRAEPLTQNPKSILCTSKKLKSSEGCNVILKYDCKVSRTALRSHDDYEAVSIIDDYEVWDAPLGLFKVAGLPALVFASAAEIFEVQIYHQSACLIAVPHDWM